MHFNSVSSKPEKVQMTPSPRRVHGFPSVEQQSRQIIALIGEAKHFKDFSNFQ